MILTDTGGTTYAPCPAGSYLARCVQLIDMGTQQSTFENKPKSARKALISWEILDDDVRRDDGQPYVVSKRFTQSLHEKAALRKTLAAWRGRDFTAQELAGFDLAALLGKDAFLSIIHADKDGKTYANIAGVMRPPKGMVCPVGCGIEPLIHWDMAAPDWAVFATLSPRLVQQIEASPEFAALTPPRSVSLTPRSAPAAPAAPAPAAPAPARPAPAAAARPAPAPQPAPAAGRPSSGFDDMDDDIPF